MTCVELTKEEAEAIWRDAMAQKERRAQLMPDIKTAIDMFTQAYYRLKELGWKEIIYHPKDGSTFEVIEPGSTGIFPCQFWEEPTRGSFWIMEDGGCPSHPVLWRHMQHSPTEAAK